jgi:hypothetical protein
MEEVAKSVEEFEQWGDSQEYVGFDVTAVVMKRSVCHLGYIIAPDYVDLYPRRLNSSGDS